MLRVLRQVFYLCFMKAPESLISFIFLHILITGRMLPPDEILIQKAQPFIEKSR